MPSVILTVRDDQGITQRLLTELTRKKIPIEAVLAYNERETGAVRVIMDIPGKDNALTAAQRLGRLEDVFTVKAVERNVLLEQGPTLVSAAEAAIDGLDNKIKIYGGE